MGNRNNATYIAERYYGRMEETAVRGCRVAYRWKGGIAPVAAWIEAAPGMGKGKGIVFESWNLFQLFLHGINGGEREVGSGEKVEGSCAM